MPRYTLYRSASAPGSDHAPAGLRQDERVRIIAEMPRLLLIECDADVAQKWVAQMEGWSMQQEQRAKNPSPPRPKLK